MLISDAITNSMETKTLVMTVEFNSMDGGNKMKHQPHTHQHHAAVKAHKNSIFVMLILMAIALVATGHLAQTSPFTIAISFLLSFLLNSCFFLSQSPQTPEKLLDPNPGWVETT